VFVALFSFQGFASEGSYETDVALAVEAGGSQSQYGLTLFYEYGADTIYRNPDQAVLWLEKAGVAAVRHSAPLPGSERQQSMVSGCLK
jgi:hypothetical protein